jgi:drug/metabolite transporter (DMT)-like permease
LTVILGLAAALSWGTGDFLGGLQARYLPGFAVALWSQLAGLLGLLLVLVVLGEPPTITGALWGLGAGVCYGIAISSLYRGLALGIMAIVAPVSACGVVVPVLASLVSGQIPSALTAVGIVAAVGGAILASLQIGGRSRANRLRPALILALYAALGFGVFFVLLDQGVAVTSGSALWIIAGARVSSVATLLVIIVLGSHSAAWPGRRSGVVAAAGVLDTAGNALFAYSAAQGNLGVAAVMASLYPVATVLLGIAILKERLALIQGAGVMLALLGVILISAG